MNNLDVSEVNNPFHLSLNRQCYEDSYSHVLSTLKVYI